MTEIPKIEQPWLVALREYAELCEEIGRLEETGECSCDSYNFHRCGLCEEASGLDDRARALMNLWSDTWAMRLFSTTSHVPHEAPREQYYSNDPTGQQGVLIRSSAPTVKQGPPINWQKFHAERDRLPEYERENFTADVIDQIDDAEFARVLARNRAIYAGQYSEANAEFPEKKKCT